MAFNGKSSNMQSIRGKPEEMQKTAQKRGMPSIFVIAGAIAAKRRAQTHIAKNAERKAASPPGLRLDELQPDALVLPSKSPARYLDKYLELAASPLGKSPNSGLLKLPVSSRRSSSLSRKSGSPSPTGRSPGGSRFNRMVNFGQKKYSGQEMTPSRSPQKRVQQKERRRSNSSRNQKIDRDAFRCQRSGDVRSAYTWDEDEDELGRGGCGAVFLARARDNPARQVAIKRVLTNSAKETEMLQEEIKMLRQLDHPNVLRLYESFEDGKTVYLVMELCKGGDLFERVREREYCTEQYCSEVAAQICGALAHCHGQGICHRDLKPENLLLLSQADDAPIKVADFGLAKHLSQASSTQASLVEACKGRRRALRKLKTFAGTLEYMAPEVIQIKDERRGTNAYYDFRCDTWGFGVIVYMMLTGNWPFKLEQVAAYVAEDVPLPDLRTELSCLSPEASDFICICLQADFTKRPYPADLLKHPFLDTKRGVMPLSITPMAKRFSHFANLSAVKKAAFTAAVRHLKAFEVEELRTHFDLFDVDRDGTVTLEEFKKAVEKWPTLVSEGFDSAEELFLALDSDGSGQISYTEFLAAAMDVKLEAREDLARRAFEAFDQTGVGEVTGQDIQRVMGGRRQGTADLAEIGIIKGEGIHFESFREHLRSPSARRKQQG